MPTTQAPFGYVSCSLDETSLNTQGALGYLAMSFVPVGNVVLMGRPTSVPHTYDYKIAAVDPTALTVLGADGWRIAFYLPNNIQVLLYREYSPTTTTTTTTTAAP